MAYKRIYGGLIWTNHAIDRMVERGLSQDMAWDAFKNPDVSDVAKKGDATEYRKKFGISLVTVLAKQNENKEWIVISAWIDPPLPGSRDAKQQASYHAYRNASGFKKLLLLLKRQLGF